MEKIIPYEIRHRLTKNPAKEYIIPDLIHCFRVLRDMGISKGKIPWGDAFLYAYFHNGPATIGERVRRALLPEQSTVFNKTIIQHGFFPASSDPNKYKIAFRIEQIRELEKILRSKYLLSQSSKESSWYIASMLKQLLYIDEEVTKFNPYIVYPLRGAKHFSDPWQEDLTLTEGGLGEDFLNRFFAHKSVFEIPGSYVLTLEQIGNKVRADLILKTAIGAIESFDSAILPYSSEEISYLEPWASSSSPAIQSLLGQFEELLNSDKAKEQDYQRFFEKNPEFLFLLGDYDSVRSQISIETDIVYSPYVNSTIARPDFFLHRFTDDTWDILDIKKATYNTPLIVGSGQSPSNALRPSAVLSRALQQLKAYENLLDQGIVRDTVKKRFDINIIAPRFILLMGQKKNFPTACSNKQISKDQGIDIYTYDQLFQIASHRMMSIRNN